jgi:hypothetical protein
MSIVILRLKQYHLFAPQTVPVGEWFAAGIGIGWRWYRLI